MRYFTLLLISAATVSLGACSTASKGTGPDTAKGADAAKPPVAAKVASSDAEQKEMAAVMGAGDVPDPAAAPVEPVSADMPPPMDINPATPANTADTAIGGEDSPDVAAMKAAASGPAPANAPKECPGVEILPDTKSITYFDDPEGKPNGDMIARASLADIKGGCDYTKDGVVVDIDMIMKGRIADKGRYEGRKDLEAFMTFPYFVAVMDPDGKMVDKKILATAMRFQPEIDDLDHAEKITQTIPLPDITQGPKYTITVGFQLNRAQLDYNRGRVGDGPKPAGVAGTKKAPAAMKADAKPKVSAKSGTTSADPLAGDTSGAAKPADLPEAAVTPPAATSSADSPATSAPAPAAAKSGGSKMSPIVE